MRIEPCQIEHFDSLILLFEEFLLEQVNYEIAFTPKPDWQDQFRQSLQKLLQSEQYFMQLLWAEGERGKDAVAGFVLYGYHEEPLFVASRWGYIADLFIRPAYRKRGFGRMLMDFSKKHLQELAVNYIHLNVLQKNQSALAFWKRVGFEEHTVRLRMPLCDISEKVQDANMREQCRAD